MAKINYLLILVIPFILFPTLSHPCLALNEDRKEYIVYMGALPASAEGYYSPQAHHLRILKNVLNGSSAAESLIYSYQRSFNGFAAKLTYEEREKIAKMQDVVSVFPSKILKLHTTRSWNFLGFPERVKRRHRKFEAEVIIGLLDTGIWPESRSFRDKGIGPPPKKWKGSCQTDGNFTCNNKLIGARYYKNHFFNDEPTARDFEGHGTHTSSIAAGRAVSGVSLYGIAKGKARGAVPVSRIAMYKVCWSVGCPDSSILAAFDDAIADGVDILSISLGLQYTLDYTSDSVAIGSFHAMQRGILVVQSAGNEGLPESVGSVAPWQFTVGASTTDRHVISKAVIGNRMVQGRALNTFNSIEMAPLIYGGNAGGNVSDNCFFGQRQICKSDCLDKNLVKGKILFCDTSLAEQDAIEVGAVGLIMEDETLKDVTKSFGLPAILLGTIKGEEIKRYIKATNNPMARILKTESTRDSAAPYVASFSSRGPNIISPGILKPDITAPGRDILAAFSPAAKLSFAIEDERSVNYNILSGTSMSCPHVSGAAAYVKSFHKNWSPASIKSALMTTAVPMDRSKNPEAEFAYGAGQINPLKALHPGLVYDTRKDDYLEFLCSENYSSEQVGLISGDKFECPEASNRTARDLNYPSMAYFAIMDRPFSANFSRRVTNVGLAKSTYKAKITPLPQLEIEVHPSVLSFSSLNQELSFVVTVAGRGLPINSIVSTSLVWSDGHHSVRSPIVVYTQQFYNE